MLKEFVLSVLVFFLGFNYCNCQDKNEAMRVFKNLEGTWDNSYFSVQDPNIKGIAILKSTLIMGGRFLKMEASTISNTDTLEGLTILGYDESSNKFSYFHIENMKNNFITSVGEFNSSDSTIKFIFKIVDSYKNLEIKTKLKMKIYSVNLYCSEIYKIEDNEQKLRF